VRPDLTIHPLSGNVDTRLRKLDDGETDALVLAVAGLSRLGRADRIDEVLALDVTVPAPGQGTLALQARVDDERVRSILALLDDRPSRLAVEAERAFLSATGGGCRSPIGALGAVDGGTLTLRVAAERSLALPGGHVAAGGVVRLVGTAPAERGAQLARQLAERVVGLRTRARVIVTRPADDAGPTIDALEAAGFATVSIPTIDIRAEPPGTSLDTTTATAAAPGTWLVATSRNGVRAAIAALDRAGVAPSAARWAVVGRGSAALLADRGVEPTVPSRPLGRVLAEELPLSPGERVLLVRGDLADPATVARFAARGVAVTEVVAYRTHEGPESSRAALAAALAEPVDAILFASGSAVRGLLALLGPVERRAALATPACCIGPTTAAAARDAGFLRVEEAATQSAAALAGLVAGIVAGGAAGGATTGPSAAAEPAPSPAPHPIEDPR
jgi:uroporphyrinogen-III synthase